MYEQCRYVSLIGIGNEEELVTMTEVPDVRYFEFDNNRIAYYKFGNGPVISIAFHGFGQGGQVFSSFQDISNTQYTIYAIDLFFHGNSQFNSPALLTKAAWQRLIGAFLQQQAVNRFSLIGYSLGGRFALSTIEGFSTRLDQLILIAPDGITYSIWYQLATSTGVGRWLFKRALKQLTFINQLGHVLTRYHLLNRTVMRFAEISLATPNQRDLIYQSWTRFRLLHPDLNNISHLLDEEPIRVRFFVGAYDRIVPGDYILPLTSRLRRYELTVFKTGHNHLIGLTIEQLT